MIFDTIFYNWDEIPLVHPIDVAIKIEERCFIFDYVPLNIHVYGSSHLNCEIAFQDKLDEIYDDFALEADDSLDESGLNIKRALLWHMNGSYSKS